MDKSPFLPIIKGNFGPLKGQDQTTKTKEKQERKERKKGRKQGQEASFELNFLILQKSQDSKVSI